MRGRGINVVAKSRVTGWEGNAVGKVLLVYVGYAHRAVWAAEIKTGGINSRHRCSSNSSSMCIIKAGAMALAGSSTLVRASGVCVEPTPPLERRNGSAVLPNIIMDMDETERRVLLQLHICAAAATDASLAHVFASAPATTSICHMFRSSEIARPVGPPAACRRLSKLPACVSVCIHCRLAAAPAAQHLWAASQRCTGSWSCHSHGSRAQRTLCSSLQALPPTLQWCLCWRRRHSRLLRHTAHPNTTLPSSSSSSSSSRVGLR